MNNSTNGKSFVISFISSFLLIGILTYSAIITINPTFEVTVSKNLQDGYSIGHEIPTQFRWYTMHSYFKPVNNENTGHELLLKLWLLTSTCLFFMLWSTTYKDFKYIFSINNLSFGDGIIKIYLNYILKILLPTIILLIIANNINQQHKLLIAEHTNDIVLSISKYVDAISTSYYFILPIILIMLHKFGIKGVMNKASHIRAQKRNLNSGNNTNSTNIPSSRFSDSNSNRSTSNQSNIFENSHDYNFTNIGCNSPNMYNNVYNTNFEQQREKEMCQKIKTLSSLGLLADDNVRREIESNINGNVNIQSEYNNSLNYSNTSNSHYDEDNSYNYNTDAGGYDLFSDNSNGYDSGGYDLFSDNSNGYDSGGYDLYEDNSYNDSGWNNSNDDSFW